MHIHNCGQDRAPVPLPARGRHLVVDIHCHIAIEAAEAMARDALPNPPPAMPFTSPASMKVNAEMFAQIAPKLNGIEQRLIDMDRLGIDVQAISPSPGQYYYFAEPDLGLSLSRTVNDGVAAAVASHPDRLVGMGTVPLQAVDLAIQEMKRCVRQLGLKGIEINSNVNGRDLDDPSFRPFFAAAEELGVMLFMHPLGFTQGQRLSDYYLNNIIGNPLESTIALSHMIFGGVLDRHPGLRLCVAHGGGYLPGYWGRMDHAWRVRPECREHIAREPSSYLRQVWCDTLVFDQDQLDDLVRRHGTDRLCLGTDYPFDMAEPGPVAFHARLDDQAKKAILGHNAVELLSLAPYPVPSRAVSS